MVKRIELLEDNLSNTERYVLGELDRQKEDFVKRELVEGYLIHMDNIKKMAMMVMNQKGYSYHGLEDFFQKIDQSIEEVIQRTPEYVLNNIEYKSQEYKIS
jgi:hypothetical protein